MEEYRCLRCKSLIKSRLEPYSGIKMDSLGYINTEKEKEPLVGVRRCACNLPAFTAYQLNNPCMKKGIFDKQWLKDIPKDKEFGNFLYAFHPKERVKYGKKK